MMMIADENVKGILTGWGLTTKPCDSCKTSSAILFCRRDSAFLCGACDAKIHQNNNNSSNNHHERVILCEVCEQAPAAVTCKADAAALCVSCDHDIHSANPLASRHDRIPVVPFFHSSEVAAAPKSSSAFLVPENDNTDVAAEAWLMPNPGGSKVAANDFFLSDIDALLNFNYTAPSLDIKPPQDHHSRNINSGDSVVPTFAAANGNLNGFVNHHPKENNYFDIDFQKPKISPFTHRVSSSDVGIVPDGNSNSHTEESNYSFPKTIEATEAAPQPVQLSREEREARVMRYREKRKNRKFEKTIRYASRKAYAESRPRIKGRFAKRGETDADEGMMMFVGGGGRGGVGGYFMVDDGGFGVVPSF